MNVDAQKASLGTADIHRLLATLPHRYPFLLVDRIIDIDGNESATGIKNVTINEPHFLGHFPNNPVMPGVLIVEAMAQTAGAISLLQRSQTQQGVVYFMTIDNAKFRKPVVPGDQMLLHVKKMKQRGNVIRFLCRAEVDGILAAEAEITAMIGVDDNNAA